MIVAVANQKGGVGKTTTAQALAAGLAGKGYRVLGIDLDPQGNFSSACGVCMIGFKGNSAGIFCCRQMKLKRSFRKAASVIK